MADGSKIEWTEATWTPVKGCTRVSEGCRNCYAEVMAARFSQPGQWGEGLATIVQTPQGKDHRWTGAVRFDATELLKPLHWKRPRKVFVCSTADLFHESVTDDQIDQVFAVTALCPQHTFQLLTKRSARMREYFSRPGVQVRAGLQAGVIATDSFQRNPRSRIGEGIKVELSDINPGALLNWPLPNVWLGISVEDQARADERIPDLLATPAAVRWLSCEPLLGPVDLTKVCMGEGDMQAVPGGGLEGCTRIRFNIDALAGVQSFSWPGLDWIVAGGESGPGARPMHPDWARSLRDQCAAAGVPFFFKQWGEHLPGEIFHPESERSSDFVHWQDGREEYNGEHIDFVTDTISHHVPEGCPYAASIAAQAQEKGWADDTVARDTVPSCPREQCRAAAYCKGDDKPWLTVAQRVGKKRAGRLLDGREHSEYPA